MYYGDPALDFFVFAPDSIFCEPMPTAIIRTYTSEGFVIAADGRKSNPETRTAIKNCVQKIFQLESPVGAFAYSIAGTLQILADDNQSIAVDLDKEIRRAADSIWIARAIRLQDYAGRLCRPLMRSLRGIIESGTISRYPEFERSVPGERGHTIFRILLDGYPDGYPCQLSIRFFHENSQLCEPEIFSQPLQPGYHFILGSERVGRLLFERKTEDERLSKFRGPDIYPEDMTLNDAIERSKSYIRACSDPAALAVDEYCYSIGGHIHIATIAPQSGFQWVPGFEPIPSDSDCNDT